MSSTSLTSAVSVVELSSVRFSPFSENLPQSYSTSPTQVTYFLIDLFLIQGSLPKHLACLCNGQCRAIFTKNVLGAEGFLSNFLGP